MTMESVQVAVLGAGVVGLSSALNIQEQCGPRVAVTIITEKVYEETTSFGSGGLFVPSVPDTDQQNAHRYRQWSEDSAKFYTRLAVGPEAGNTGVIIATGYNLANEDHEEDRNPLYKDIIFSHRRLTRKEMTQHGFDNYKYGYEETSFILDQTKYLIWLMKKFEANGGKVRRQKLFSLSELGPEFSVVVNCCGLGSRELFGDKNVYAVRGHLIRVKAPWIKHWIFSELAAYVIPREDTVTLGGTKQKDNESMEIDPVDTAQILERCEKLCPRLKGAVVDHQWVGLRPCRNGIRVELEHVNQGGRTFTVVHNYGHGPNGVAFSWGTAVETARLVDSYLKSNISKL